MELLNTYGLAPGYTQEEYDQRAFSMRLSPDHGTPPRVDLFKRCAEYLIPGHFEYHDWTEKLLYAVCNRMLVGIPGCSGCVAGETKILNPLTGEEPTIQFLTENRVAPIVMTLDGPRQAEVPYVKGVADLFEVVLEDGRSFVATSEHRVLLANANRYSHVGDLHCGQYLLSYGPTLPQSTSGTSRSARASGAPCSLKRVASFQGDYRRVSHSYDERLRILASSARSFSPSPVGVPERSQGDWYSDDLDTSNKRSPALLHAVHRSMMDYGNHRNSSGIHASLRSYPEIPSREFQSCRQRGLFHSGNTYRQPSLTPTHGSIHSDSVAQLKIVAIRRLRQDVFYDISVPGPQHYFAHGCIHHNSAKTYNIANFCAVWWLVEPSESSVILVSTSRESLRRRAWSEISRCYSQLPVEIRGNFVDSRMVWHYDYGDARHAIFGKAVEEGSVTKVADDIKGIHTRRQMVVIDEATSVPEAIFDACSNLFSYPEEFILVVMGNPRNRLDQFSKFIEPADGWSSVTVDDEEWEGKPQHEYGGAVPLVIRFDAEKSPNIVEGKIVSRHLPLPHLVEARKKAAGGQTPLWWSNFRGFPPPEGICKTVFSESAIAAQNGFGKFEFSGEAFQIIGGFDHARNGGDRPALRFAKLGVLADGKLGIQWMPPIVLSLSAQSQVPIDFQLAEQVRLHCEHFVYKDVDYHCPFENLAVDATGEGAGFADILQRTVSAKIVRVMFSAAASEDAASLEDIRPAREAYENKRVEMFFRSRDLLNHGQLRGIDRETAVELCTLEFDDSSRRIKLMSKKDYRKKFRKSPDYADCGVLCCEMARIKGLRLVPQGETVERYADFEEVVSNCQQVFANANYEPEGLDFYDD